eukprot:COSAG02_NODE_23588_length_714_cov_0.848780_1_plen_43_part_10
MLELYQSSTDLIHMIHLQIVSVSEGKNPAYSAGVADQRRGRSC